jgi:CRISPR/Cas system-associated exonuclease Cas4 (RecB family)
MACVWNDTPSILVTYKACQKERHVTLFTFMAINLTKSLYIQYLKCPTAMWLKKHAKEDLPKHSEYDKFIMNQGNEFEEIVRTTYEDGILVETYGEKAAEDTKVAIEKGANAIFQATVIADGYQVMADVLIREKNESWSIHEVKASTRKKDKDGIKSEHIPDIAFQKMVFEKAGYNIGSLSLVYINKDYIKNGEIDPKAITEVIEVDEQVANIKLETEEQAKKAKRILNIDTRPDIKECPCQVSPCGSSSYNMCQCPQYCYPDLPECSVFDIPNIGMKKAKNCLRSGITAVHQCDSSDFTDRQAFFIEMEKSKKPHIDKEALKSTLGELQYPLLYLDYETCSLAVPIFDNYKPWQQIVFQYSLHVQKTADTKLQHFEFLWNNQSDPVPELAKTLEEQAGYDGTVIVWNKSFECKRNDEMGVLVPKYHDFFKSLNSRIFDLRDIVHNHFYAHPEFKGSESIKKVLPVLCPELAYQNLEVQGGSTATLLWDKMINGEADEKKTTEDLLRYCERDTYAMVKLYEAFLGAC